MESAMKMARQYFMEVSPKQPARINFIARDGSYHGTTLGALSMSGHVARRGLFEGMLLPNIGRVSACNAYRGMKEGQTVEEYVQDLADELDRKFQEMGPETVCAFVAEPVVGAVCLVSLVIRSCRQANQTREDAWVRTCRARILSRYEASL
jgi:adenosylmethionine-8-amino-7-oxononanoate aminotransferase